MKTADLDPELFIENRRRLRARLLPNSIAVVHANDVMPTNADGTMPFQQNADLFYLTGVNQEESILLLAPDAAGEFRLQAGAVVFPSSWALEEKLGRTMDEIHGIVPGLNPALPWTSAWSPSWTSSGWCRAGSSDG